MMKVKDQQELTRPTGTALQNCKIARYRWVFNFFFFFFFLYVNGLCLPDYKIDFWFVVPSLPLSLQSSVDYFTEVGSLVAGSKVCCYGGWSTIHAGSAINILPIISRKPACTETKHNKKKTPNFQVYVKWAPLSLMKTVPITTVPKFAKKHTERQAHRSIRIPC